MSSIQLHLACYYNIHISSTTEEQNATHADVLDVTREAEAAPHCQQILKRSVLLYLITINCGHKGNVAQYIGDPDQRSSLEFLMTCDARWNAYNHDLSYVEAFRSYCASIPELWPMLYTEKEYRKMRIALNKSEITDVSPGDVRHVDLRSVD